MTRIDNLEQAIKTIDQAIELSQQRDLLLKKLKYTLLRELHDTSPIFWLDGKKQDELIKLYREHQQLRHDIGMTLTTAYGSGFWREAKDWRFDERQRWEKKQGEKKA